MAEETHHSAMPDELDDLYNYDVADDQHPPQNQPNAVEAPPLNSAEPGEADVLGINEEVQVKKQRKPIAKLDEDRLLSNAGLPKLRKIAKTRMKFKGKGHEFSDVTRLLNIYQLWLDDLYPRAKFADGLAIIEKRGHSKRMQRQRLEWIGEEKPKHAGHHTSDDEEAPTLAAQQDNFTNEAATAPRSADTTMEGAHNPPENEHHLHTDDESEEDRNTSEDEHAQADEEPPEDELDALFAENAAAGPEKSSLSKDLEEARLEDQIPRDDFEDDMEAMAEFDDF